MKKENTPDALLRQADSALDTQEHALRALTRILATHRANQEYLETKHAALLAELANIEQTMDKLFCDCEQEQVLWEACLTVCDAEYLAATAIHNALPGEIYVPPLSTGQ